MQGFRNILVGVDLSHADRLVSSELGPPTQEAVRRAIWLAGQLSSDLTFFSALDISAQTEELLTLDAEHVSQTVQDDANQVLEELVANAKQEGIEAKSRLATGKDWVEVIRQVLRGAHDLVIVGTRDRSDISRLLFGSTGMKLLRYCPCPVWVTRPDPNWEDLVMLVATDLGEVGQDALDIAINGAQMSNAKVHVLHALESGFDRHMLHAGLPKEQRDAFRKQQWETAEQALYEQLSMTDYRTLTYGVQAHVVDGPPDAAILQAIEEHGIDLLVMGTVARCGIPGLLVGNTAERILPEVNCSVLAIKPADFQCPITLD